MATGAHSLAGRDLVTIERVLGSILILRFCVFRLANMHLDTPKVVPLTCHGHSRPVTHLTYSAVVEEDQYYLISASKGS